MPISDVLSLLKEQTLGADLNQTNGQTANEPYAGFTHLSSFREFSKINQLNFEKRASYEHAGTQ
jgi:hypothetical protein